MPKVLNDWLNEFRTAGRTNISLDAARKVLARRRQDMPAPAMTLGKIKFFDEAGAERILAMLNERRAVAAMAG